MIHRNKQSDFELICNTKAVKRENEEPLDVKYSILRKINAFRKTGKSSNNMPSGGKSEEHMNARIEVLCACMYIWTIIRVRRVAPPSSLGCHLQGPTQDDHTCTQSHSYMCVFSYRTHNLSLQVFEEI
jgi:hypothetical protein